MRVLIDTCVVIDVLQDRLPFATAAQKIFLGAASREFNACLSAKSIMDIYYLPHRQTHSDSQTRKIIRKLFTLFSMS